MRIFVTRNSVFLRREEHYKLIMTNKRYSAVSIIFNYKEQILKTCCITHGIRKVHMIIMYGICNQIDTRPG